MSRVAPATFWEEPDARNAATRAILAYPTHAGGRWYLSTDPDDQLGSFTLRDGRVFLDPGVVTGSRAALLGPGRRVALIGLPASTVLSFYSPGLSITAARTGSAAQLRTYGA